MEIDGMSTFGQQSSPDYQAKIKRLCETVQQKPNAMTLQLARQIDLPEVEVIRNHSVARAFELDISRWEDLLRALQAAGEVRVLVSNDVTTVEVTGRFGGFSTIGEFFNVQTSSLDLHIRWQELGSAFAVEKPSHIDGRTTYSVQFFDRNGNAALKVFLCFATDLRPEAHELFCHIREEFSTPVIEL